MGTGVKIPICMQIGIFTLILSLQYDIMAYLYIENKITSFAKLTDMGGNWEFSSQKTDMDGNGEFSTKKY